MKKIAPVLFSAFLSVLAIAPAAHAASNDSYVIEEVKTKSDGSIHINTLGNLCQLSGAGSPFVDFVVVPANTVGIDRMLSVALAAQLSGQRLRIEYNALNCIVTSINIFR